jgi:hypothetical protein
MYFSGIESIDIQIFTNKEAILGPSNLQLRCDYTLAKGETVLASNIQAKFDDGFKDIALFKANNNGDDPKLSPSGSYLSSRANLSNPTPSLPGTVILTFNQIECEDEREYKCKTAFLNSGGSTSLLTSNATSIVVKGKYA